MLYLITYINRYEELQYETENVVFYEINSIISLLLNESWFSNEFTFIYQLIIKSFFLVYHLFCKLLKFHHIVYTAFGYCRQIAVVNLKLNFFKLNYKEEKIQCQYHVGLRCWRWQWCDYFVYEMYICIFQLIDLPSPESVIFNN